MPSSPPSPAAPRPRGLLGVLASLFKTYALPADAVRLTGPFARDDRHCYLAPVPPEWRSDANGGSELTLFEDGLPLGPGGCGHDDIRTLGRGRWSHWGPTLFFSASDRTDPNRNGRVYSLRPPPDWSGRLPASSYALPEPADKSIRGPGDGDAPAPRLEWETVALAPGSIEPRAGRAWTASVPGAWPSDDGDVSTLLLLEDGRPLGPAHQPHAAIEADGGGRYSHWQQAVIFSTSDDSDPRTNGRTYSLAHAEALLFRQAPSAPEPDDGLAWVLAGLPARWASDAEGRSRLVLLEDGRPLGPAHALHDEVRALGAGRYSHWGRRLLFSTSDGTDPRTNGRTYSLVLRD